MRTAVRVVAVVVVAALSLIHAQAKTDRVLDKLAVEFAAAYNAHDAAKVAAFYADDAVLMVPNEPMIKGRKSIEMHYNEEFGRGAVHLRITPLESVVSGDRGFEMGSATVTLGAFSDEGKYIVIYKRVGRDWKIAYDIFNSDQTEPSIRNPDVQATWGSAPHPGSVACGDPYAPRRSLAGAPCAPRTAIGALLPGVEFGPTRSLLSSKNTVLSDRLAVS